MAETRSNGVVDESAAFRVASGSLEEARAVRYVGIIVALITPVLIACIFLLDRIDDRVKASTIDVKEQHNRDIDKLDKRLDAIDHKLDRLLDRKP